MGEILPTNQLALGFCHKQGREWHSRLTMLVTPDKFSKPTAHPVQATAFLGPS